MLAAPADRIATHVVYQLRTQYNYRKRLANDKRKSTTMDVHAPSGDAQNSPFARGGEQRQNWDGWEVPLIRGVGGRPARSVWQQRACATSGWDGVVKRPDKGLTDCVRGRGRSESWQMGPVLVCFRISGRSGEGGILRGISLLVPDVWCRRERERERNEGAAAVCCCRARASRVSLNKGRAWSFASEAISSPAQHLEVPVDWPAEVHERKVYPKRQAGPSLQAQPSANAHLWLAGDAVDKRGSLLGAAGGGSWKSVAKVGRLPDMSLSPQSLAVKSARTATCTVSRFRILYDNSWRDSASLHPVPCHVVKP